MILSGKDLFKYRVNQIKNFATMVAVAFAMVASMMALVIAYC